LTEAEVIELTDDHQHGYRQGAQSESGPGAFAGPHSPPQRMASGFDQGEPCARAVTPFGGLSFLAGWAVLIWAAQGLDPI
jgi:hypothetical protein